MSSHSRLAAHDSRFTAGVLSGGDRFFISVSVSGPLSMASSDQSSSQTRPSWKRTAKSQSISHLSASLKGNVHYSKPRTLRTASAIAAASDSTSAPVPASGEIVTVISPLFERISVPSFWPAA